MRPLGIHSSLFLTETISLKPEYNSIFLILNVKIFFLNQMSFCTIFYRMNELINDAFI